MQKIKVILVLTLVMASLLGCGEALDTILGEPDVTIKTSFVNNQGIPIRTTGIKVELMDANSQGVLDSKTTNGEDIIIFEWEMPVGETRKFFLRVTLTDGRVITSDLFECTSKYGACPDCINFSVRI